MKKEFLLFLLFLGVALNSFGGALEDFVSNKCLKNSDVGVCVVDIVSGNVVSQSGGEQFLTPASTLKIITAASADRLLGADFRYSTKVYIDGDVDSRGVLNGYVRIVGSGDPTLGSRRFPEQPIFVDQIVAALKDKGIKQINGNILTDESIFSRPAYPLGITLDDVAEDYGAGAFGLNFSDNVCAVKVDLSGKYAKIINENPLVSIAFENNIKICSSKDTKASYLPKLIRGVDSNVINMIGKVKQSSRIKNIYTSIPNPAKFLRDSLIQSITVNGIIISSSNGVVADKSEMILDFKSPRMADILKLLLVRSDNMFSDCVLRTIAVNAGKPGSLNDGAVVLKEYWGEQGVDVRGLVMEDGSGLSRSNKLQANLLAKVLIDMHKNEPANVKYHVPFPLINGNEKVRFHAQFPIAGESGTVRSLLKGTDYVGQYALKSGSLSNVQCFAGYYPANDPQYVVVVLTNFYYCSRKEIVKAIEELLIGISNEIKANKNTN